MFTANDRLQLGVGVKIVQDHGGSGVPLQLDDHARVLVRLVADRADAGDDFLVHELGDALDEEGAIDVVGNLLNDDALAARLGVRLKFRLAADLDAAAAAAEILTDARHPVNHAAGRKIRPLDVLAQADVGDIGIVNLRTNRIDHLTEIMRRNVRGHADSDAGASVDEQVREGGGENDGLGGGFVVVRDKIDRVLAHVVHQRGAEVRQARLGVTHGGGRIALDRSEVSLSVHQAFAHGPWLRHVHERRIDHRLAVRMVIARRVARDLGALSVLPPREERQVMHRVKDAALGRLEAVARIGQRAGDNHAHRVIEEGARHLLGDIDGLDFVVRFGHWNRQKGRRLAVNERAAGMVVRECSPKPLGGNGNAAGKAQFSSSFPGCVAA